MTRSCGLVQLSFTSLFVSGVQLFGPWNTQLWIVPWFIGFALFGAGLSGICPMVLGLKRLGFR